MDWHTFVKLTHILGTVLGVGGTTFAEIFYLKFGKDAKIDHFENDVLRICYRVIRLGLIILVFSGFGYLILWRLNFLGPQVFFSPRMLAKYTVILVLLLTTFLVNFRLIKLEIGSAIATTSWYTAMILGIWRKPGLSYIVLLLGYLVTIVLVYFALQFIRNKYWQSKQS